MKKGHRYFMYGNNNDQDQPVQTRSPFSNSIYAYMIWNVMQWQTAQALIRQLTLIRLQANLSLRLAYTSEGIFSDLMAHMVMVI